MGRNEHAASFLATTQRVLVMLGAAFWSSLSVACEKYPLDFLTPLVGEWNQFRVDGTERTFLGTLRSELAAGGCALVQYFESPNGEFSYVSLSAFEDDGVFVERYALSTGRMAVYQWDNSAERLQQIRLVNKPNEKRHFVFLDITDKSYFIADERSDDGGDTWRRVELVQLVRRAAAGQPSSD
ncbi:MAG: hypothetical protein AAGC71_09240 [Pseudomonadota bacterium]